MVGSQDPARWRRSSSTDAPGLRRTGWALAGPGGGHHDSEPHGRVRRVSHLPPAPHHADWPYRVFTWPTAARRESATQILDGDRRRAWTSTATIAPFLYSRPTFKKVRLQSFTDRLRPLGAEHSIGRPAAEAVRLRYRGDARPGGSNATVYVRCVRSAATRSSSSERGALHGSGRTTLRRWVSPGAR